ncbi:hypothetical protein LPJ66_010976, partial [Kickxella alabastrina]
MKHSTSGASHSGSNDTKNTSATTAATGETNSRRKNEMFDAVLNGRRVATTTKSTSNTASTVASIRMSPSSCTVLIVDKQFLKGVYYTGGSGGPTMRAGPAQDD